MIASCIVHRCAPPPPAPHALIGLENADNDLRDDVMIRYIIIVVDIGDIVDDPIDDDDDDVSNNLLLPLHPLLQSPTHPSGGTPPFAPPPNYRRCQWEKFSLSSPSSPPSACNIIPADLPSHTPTLLTSLRLRLLSSSVSSLIVSCSSLILTHQVIVVRIYVNKRVVSFHRHVVCTLCPLQSQHVVLLWILFVHPCRAPP